MLSSDFYLEPDKSRVLSTLDCKGDSPACAETRLLYDELASEAVRLAVPRAAFAFAPNAGISGSDVLRNCSQVIYCLVTIGNGIEAKASEYFAQGCYLEGVILDAIGNDLLFGVSRQVYHRLACEASIRGLGLTRRLTPGEENDFPLSWQKQIIEHVRNEDLCDVTLTPGGMLRPVKSLAYLYGAAAGVPHDPLDKDCSTCGRIDCRLRDTASKREIFTLTVNNSGQRITCSVQAGTSIAAAMTKDGMKIGLPCGGRGTCGKCRVNLIAGRVWCADKQAIETADGVTPRSCLACQSFPDGNCEIDITDIRERGFTTASWFTGGRAGEPSAGFAVIPVELSQKALETGQSMTSLVERACANRLKFSLRALNKSAVMLERLRQEALPDQEPKNTLFLVTADRAVSDVCWGEPPAPHGIVVDIGTTTVVAAIVNLTTGIAVRTVSLLNSQRRFGADVISRIQSATKGHAQELQASIRANILQGIDELDVHYPETICVMAIAGNTTMLHLLLGLPCRPMAAYPFNPVTMGLMEFRFAEIFATDILDCQVILLPGISAYVGADIVAGMLHCRMDQTESITMLIDIGTNGEMVVGSKNRFLCLAAAAGPAFEGVNISCGTGSVRGAISAFRFTADGPVITTIGDEAPVGICGSGVVDIVAEFLRTGNIDATGRINGGRCEIPIAADPEGIPIVFTQKDVREFQLAKAAIRTGIEVLCREYGCSYSQIACVYLAGSFGTHINVESACAVGMIPYELKEKVIGAGNSSLGGAADSILDARNRQVLQALSDNTTHVDLAANKDFNELFIDYMYFAGMNE